MECENATIPLTWQDDRDFNSERNYIEVWAVMRDFMYHFILYSKQCTQ